MIRVAGLGLTPRAVEYGPTRAVVGRDSDREDPRSRLRDETLRIEYPPRISHGTVRLGRTTSLHSLESSHR